MAAPPESGDEVVELEARLARHPAERYPVQHATTAFHLGTAHLQRGRVEESLALIEVAQRIFEGLGMRLEAAKATTMLGAAHREAGHVDLARRSFELADAAFALLDQPAEQGAAVYNLGLVLAAAEEPVAAQAAMESAYELFVRGAQPARAGAARREQGAALVRAGRPGEAVALLEEAASLAERGGDLAGLGAAANVLGLAHLATGDPSAAVSALTGAVGAFPRSLRPAEHAMAKANLALAYEQGDNPARARLCARQAAALPSADPHVLAQAQQVLARVSGTAEQDLLAVLDAESSGRWPEVIREEAARWHAASPGERGEALRGFGDGLLRRPDSCHALAESLLAVLVELPPDPYAELVGALVEAVDGRTEEERDRLQAMIGSALARFAIPQWQRLAASLNAAETARGRAANWR